MTDKITDLAAYREARRLSGPALLGWMALPAVMVLAGWAMWLEVIKGRRP